MNDEPALIVFARNPVPGKTKTRLIPALGPERAAELYRCFLLDTLGRAAGSPAAVTVAVADAADLDDLRVPVAEACPGARITAQSGADLGERMSNAFRDALAEGHPCAVILGSDAPSLCFDRVSEALTLARQADLVLGPCLDGGYYLIGLHVVMPVLFQNIAWGSPSVLIDTLQAAKATGCFVSLLEPWYDVDTPQDLAALCTHLTALSLTGQEIPCPRTWRCIQELAMRE